MDFMTVLAVAADSTGVGQPVGQASPGGGFLGLLPMIIAMIAIFYFLVMRPQKKQEKARQEMLKTLKKGDKVVTIGGIHGVVASVRDKDVTLRVDDTGNVKLRFSVSAISRVVTDEDEGEEPKKGDLG
jgi:preprotein translocase subunit YajC